MLTLDNSTNDLQNRIKTVAASYHDADERKELDNIELELRSLRMALAVIDDDHKHADFRTVLANMIDARIHRRHELWMKHGHKSGVTYSAVNTADISAGDTAAIEDATTPGEWSDAVKQREARQAS